MANAAFWAKRESISRRIYLIRSFPDVRREWDRLETAQKRTVLAELNGDITAAWALQVIRDVREAFHA